MSNRRVHPLRALGFQRPDRAEVVVSGWPADLVRRVAASPAPDVAAESLHRMAARGLNLDGLAAEPGWLDILLAVMGASDALTRRLENETELASLVRPPFAPSSPSRLRARLLACGDPDATRAQYHRELLLIAAADLTAPDPLLAVDVTVGRLSHLADAAVAAMLAHARREVTGSDDGPRLAVVAMGKCGAQELNYVSDVDVIWVAEGSAAELEVAARIASTTMRLCAAHSPSGTLWPLDAGLRPEGNAGSLVRTMDSMRSYYRQWAKPWEFQALLKARPMAGDMTLASEFCAMVAPQVWRVGDQSGFVSQVQAMRRRVVSLLPAKEAAREIKLGQGGLRDVEFSVQLLQLVHGRTDDRIRQRGTLPALEALIDHGYVGRETGARLRRAYRVERLLEHRAQLLTLRRTHLLPVGEATLTRLSRGLAGVFPEGVERAWKQTSREVGELQARIFYSPVLEAVASIPTEETRLTGEAVDARLRAVGFEDPTTARGHIHSLIRGHSRRAAIQRQLMPALLGWLGQTPNPDAGLLAFRKLAEDLGEAPWYLRALRDEGGMAPRLARVLGTSRYVVDLLSRDGAPVGLLAREDELQPQSLEKLDREMSEVCRRSTSVEAAVVAIRGVRRRELLRLALGEVLGLVQQDELGRGLSAVVEATLTRALGLVSDELGAPRVGVIAMGRWGGEELGFASDADALFVVADGSDIDVATRAVARTRKLLELPGPEPALAVDADLRPEGRSGPMVRTVVGYRQYYAKWSAPWEAQALLRARAVGTDPSAHDVVACADAMRWPENGPTAAALAQMRKLKARMETERTRGSDPRRNTKLGPGALSDVEWCVQLLQLSHAGAVPALRSTGTLAALRAAVESEVLAEDDAATLEKAWRLATRVRNAIVLVRAKPSDQLPTDARELGAVAFLLGYSMGETSQFLDDYLAVMRRSRAVTERVFYGPSE